MTALTGIGLIVLFLLLIFLAPVSAQVSQRRGQLAVQLHYFFFRIQLFPFKPKKEARKKAKRKPEAAKEKKKTDITAALIWELVKTSRRGLRILRRHIVFSNVQIYISVGGEDARETALNQAKYAAAVAAMLDVIGLLFVLKPPRVGILPDFTSSETRYDLSFRAGIRPFFALMAGSNILIRFFRLKRRSEPLSPVQHAE